MNSHKWISFILTILLLAATIAVPSSTTAAEEESIAMPASLQNIPGAASGWWAADQIDVHMTSIQGLPVNPNWVGESNQANAGYGWSVDTAGDVNGDGYDDVIVGVPDYVSGTVFGAAAVYHGSPSGLSPSPNWFEDGGEFAANFGLSVSSAGDVNGDGYDDVIIGDPDYDNGQFGEGGAVVYLGSSTGLSHTINWYWESNQAQANFGWSVNTAGDINGDGYDDIIVGAPFYNNGQVDEGAAAVFFGSASGVSHSIGWIGESNQADARYGFSADTAGDVNHDGYDDIIVGAFNYSNGQEYEGAAAVYYGSASGLSVNPNWMKQSNLAGINFGYAAGAAGDVNGDGYDDVIIGAPYYVNGQGAEGAAFVFKGSASGLLMTPAWGWEPNRMGAFYGISVGTAGDINGDGYDDVIVGASYYSNGQTNEGAAVVHLGSSAGLPWNPAWSDEGDQEYAEFGNSVNTAGDVNGDGRDDIIVGAPYYSHGQIHEGVAAVYQGSGYYYLFLPLTVKSQP